MVSSDLLFKEESYNIVGACFEVYREQGCGFLEPVYQECLQIEMRMRGIPFVAQMPVTLEYKGVPLSANYRPDFLCHQKIVLELKAVTTLGDEHRAQVLNYLKATHLTLGLLVNFGHHPKLEIVRVAAERGRFSNRTEQGIDREIR